MWKEWTFSITAYQILHAANFWYGKKDTYLYNEDEKICDLMSLSVLRLLFSILYLRK